MKGQSYFKVLKGTHQRKQNSTTGHQQKEINTKIVLKKFIYKVYFYLHVNQL